MYNVKNWYNITYSVWLLETGLSQNSSTFLLNLVGKTYFVLQKYFMNKEGLTLY